MLARSFPNHQSAGAAGTHCRTSQTTSGSGKLPLSFRHKLVFAPELYSYDRTETLRLSRLCIVQQRRASSAATQLHYISSVEALFEQPHGHVRKSQGLSIEADLLMFFRKLAVAVHAGAVLAGEMKKLLKVTVTRYDLSRSHVLCTCPSCSS